MGKAYKIEYLPIGKVKLNEGNPRFIKDDAFKRLVKSLDDCPDLFRARPLICSDRTGELIVLGGNMRLRAAKELKYKEVPVIIMPGLTEEQEQEITIKDNGGFGEWDFEILANEWSHLPLVEWGVDIPEGLIDQPEPTGDPRDAEPQIDRAEELNKKWRIKAGDLWTIGEHRLLCGDSTKADGVERVMGGDNADCIFTSPPYAVGIDYGATYQDTIESLREMLPKLAALWWGIVREGGYAVVNFGDVVSGGKIIGEKCVCQYPMALEYWPVFRNVGWLLWSQRIWCKPIGRVSAPWCASSNRGATNWEHIWTWRKPGGEQTKPKTGNEMSSMHGWCDSSHMDGVAVGKNDHGAGMATGIAAWMIHVHTDCGCIIVEPFCGTGTTMVACQNLSRKCRGIEISPAYCAVILERMATAFPELKIERAE